MPIWDVKINAVKRKALNLKKQLALPLLPSLEGAEIPLKTSGKNLKIVFSNSDDTAHAMR
jgi:hypothetical protein